MKNGDENLAMERICTAMTWRFRWVLANLPRFFPQFACLFCAIPISLAFSSFCITFLVNFGVAIIAQTISIILILLIFIPTITICLICAVFVACSFDFAKHTYTRCFLVENLDFKATKLKIC
ncbi:unnamed protein product [Caenorhabditis angaria]|uniref:Uncharacterized protein n=1 Tax=Caenorhabditis angaria TaxID=860376 RepID=A0A9P1MZ14_9PELO|nr:unnamed protein product [Caenorhabditis angaria]